MARHLNSLRGNVALDGASALRGLRANPPGQAAADNERRSVFTSALEQAEQFLAAAAQVGFATKPVQLFYALSQAGRAIAAVHANDIWKIRGHGASVSTSTSIGTTTVTPDSKTQGAIRVVADATRSGIWQGGATLAALWASLPELDTDPQLCGTAQGALEVEPVQESWLWAGAIAAGYEVTGYGQFATKAILQLDRRYPDKEEMVSAVDDILKPYPRARGWAMVDPPLVTASTSTGLASGSIATVSSDSRRAWLTWPSAVDGQSRPTRLGQLTEVIDDRCFFRPAVDGNETIPSRLITWWGVLLALSSLARYEPVAWRAALDIDASTTGWALERGLTAAQRLIPELVLAAITYEDPPLY